MHRQIITFLAPPESVRLAIYPQQGENFTLTFSSVWPRDPVPFSLHSLNSNMLPKVPCIFQSLTTVPILLFNPTITFKWMKQHYHKLVWISSVNPPATGGPHRCDLISPSRWNQAEIHQHNQWQNILQQTPSVPLYRYMNGCRHTIFYLNE